MLPISLRTSTYPPHHVYLPTLCLYLVYFPSLLLQWISCSKAKPYTCVLNPSLCRNISSLFCISFPFYWISLISTRHFPPQLGDVPVAPRSPPRPPWSHGRAALSPPRSASRREPRLFGGDPLPPAFGWPPSRFASPSVGPSSARRSPSRRLLSLCDLSSPSTELRLCTGDQPGKGPPGGSWGPSESPRQRGLPLLPRPRAQCPGGRRVARG